MQSSDLCDLDGVTDLALAPNGKRRDARPPPANTCIAYPHLCQPHHRLACLYKLVHQCRKLLLLIGMDNPVAANVLGTIGAVCWSVQLLPQIWLNYRRHNAVGLQPTMVSLMYLYFMYSDM